MGIIHDLSDSILLCGDVFCIPKCELAKSEFRLIGWQNYGFTILEESIFEVGDDGFINFGKVPSSKICQGSVSDFRELSGGLVVTLSGDLGGEVEGVIKNSAEQKLGGLG